MIDKDTFTQVTKAAVEEMKGAIVDDVVNRVVARLLDHAKRQEPPSEFDVRTRVFNVLANHPLIDQQALVRWLLEAITTSASIDKILAGEASTLPFNRSLLDAELRRREEELRRASSPAFEIVRLLRLNGEHRAKTIALPMSGVCLEDMETGQKFYPTNLRDSEKRRIFVQRPDVK